MTVSLTLAVARGIPLESALSFFGVGVQAPNTSWGNMLYQGQAALATAPWLALMPGLFILATRAFGDRRPPIDWRREPERLPHGKPRSIYIRPRERYIRARRTRVVQLQRAGTKPAEHPLLNLATYPPTTGESGES